jgi:hypothetical protein
MSFNLASFKAYFEELIRWAESTFEYPQYAKIRYFADQEAAEIFKGHFPVGNLKNHRLSDLFADFFNSSKLKCLFV